MYKYFLCSICCLNNLLNILEPWELWWYPETMTCRGYLEAFDWDPLYRVVVTGYSCLLLSIDAYCSLQMNIDTKWNNIIGYAVKMWLIFWASSMLIHSFSVMEISKVMKLLLLWVKYQPDCVLSESWTNLLLLQGFHRCKWKQNVVLHSASQKLPWIKRWVAGKKIALAFKCLTHEPDHVAQEAEELLDTAKGNLQWKLTAVSIMNPNVLSVQMQVKLRIRSVLKE